MRTRADVDPCGHGPAPAGAARHPAPRDPPAWALGSRIATRNIRVARRAYLRYAEVAERAMNTVESTTSRVGRDVCSVASGAREALLHLHRQGPASPPRTRAPGAWSGDAIRAKIDRGRADLRDIAWRGQVAADTNVRAYLDCLDDLATASSARNFVSVQSTFFWDQWQRSLRQAFDLQQRTVVALRKIAAAPAV